MSQTLHKPLAARLGVLVAAVLTAFGVVLATASPASAHDELLGSDPAAGSTVAALPTELALTFSAEIADDEGASVVEVTDAAGTSLAGGTPTVRDNVLTQPLTGEASGAVTVLWKVVSSDGHPISGEFSFTVEGAPAPTPTETASPAPTETTAPVETATPTPTATALEPEDAGSSSADAWPWVIFGIIALGVLGAVAYLLLSRARREKDLDAAREQASGGASGPGSEPPADH
ncbi:MULTISPECIES: copper resistance CopC family protein [Microbacterium]|uniref:copper resistance CopC family protein n=1 Tax=Microbacterium TaxID=33882 RepID=UPI000D647C44|nr:MULTISPECIES: copper resistance CopC family protein [Microbacterium]